MIRSGFKAKVPERKPAKQISCEYTLRPRATASAAPDTRWWPEPKQKPIQHQGYMAAVRRLPCIRCGVAGLTQFCHADEGKGMALKSDCRLGWPGCGPDYMGNPGCHWFVGTSGRMGKEARREFEAMAGRATRDAIRSAGQWPKNMPEMVEDDAR